MNMDRSQMEPLLLCPNNINNNSSDNSTKKPSLSSSSSKRIKKDLVITTTTTTGGGTLERTIMSRHPESNNSNNSNNNKKSNEIIPMVDTLEDGDVVFSGSCSPSKQLRFHNSSSSSSIFLWRRHHHLFFFFGSGSSTRNSVSFVRMSLKLLGILCLLYTILIFVGISSTIGLRRTSVYDMAFHILPLQKMGFGTNLVIKKEDDDNAIRAISILGERNSGTRWIYEHMEDCFNHSLEVERRLTRYKHWFQYRNDSRIKQQTLVLTLFRNIYEWTEAMRLKPHHASNHIHLEWKEFITRPWTTDRVGLDLEIVGKSTDQRNILCQEHFQYNEVISCHKKPYPPEYWNNNTRRIRWSEHQPLYELRQDGTAYESILDMRAAKIQNFLNVSTYSKVSEVWVLRYEDLVLKGTANLIEQIENITGVEAHCQPFDAQVRDQRSLDGDMIDWIVKHADWDAERMIGYSV